MNLEVSKGYGVEVIQLDELRLDSNMFCDFLRDCKQLPKLKSVLFGDNAPIHTSNVTRRFLNSNQYVTCKSIQPSDVDVRKDLCKNIILSGGNTMYTGLHLALE